MKSQPFPASARVAVLYFAHETVTFLPNDTTLEDFVYEGSPAAGDALLASDPRGYIGGFVRAAGEYPWLELVGIESPLFPKTGIGSGWVQREAYEHYLGKILEELTDLGPFEGVYMALHGAMAVRGIDRPEADIARRVRAVVGAKAAIAATFDPHGNEDEAFLQHADMAFACKYYPHYDSFLQGERAARGLMRTIKGDYRPVSATLKVPIVSPTVMQWTGAPTWMGLIQRALTWEAREPDVVVNVYFGFPWADVPDGGMTIQVITNHQASLAQQIAQDMAESAWRNRHALVVSTTIHHPKEGVRLAMESVAEGRRPVVIADHSDRSGAAAWILRELLAQEAAKVVVATITDAATIERLQTAAPGDFIELAVGGGGDASAGEPVTLQGQLLQSTSAHATLRFGADCRLVVSRYLNQVMEPRELARYGIDPEAFDIFVLKSRVHFRRGFDDTGFAKTIILVEPEQPFLGTTQLDALPYQALPLRRLFPYDQSD
jgi:microcystin degradation protein MlrC